MRLFGSLLFISGLALAASALHADAASAAADFKLGQAQQAAKQWGPAAKLYLKVLQDDPQATYAYKALGTVYYQAGDKRGALAYYDRYLTTHPQDTATKGFADSL
jgi:tetratricopeptide (TPR) repeat protein